MRRWRATTPRTARAGRAARAAGLCLLLTLGACGAPSTFISTTPPPDMTAEAWYGSSVPDVVAAIGGAMRDAMIAVDPSGGDAGTIIGTKQQVPYVGPGAGEPAPGPLPLYRVSVSVMRQGDLTHARAAIDVVCTACGSRAPYEWEYPGDLFRDIFEVARRTLSDKGAHASYPPRYKPVRWRPPKRY